MRFASYNIQYGTGKDGLVDLGRIARDLGQADIMALQEVTRGPESDQPEELAALFQRHHWVYAPSIDLDASRVDPDGRVIRCRRQFGNMIISRYPILSTRTHLLPRRDTPNRKNLQRVALEGVIDAPGGPLRAYSVHLAHGSAGERLLQAQALLDIVNRSPGEGGVLSGPVGDGDWAKAWQPTPMPRSAVVMGDFNGRPGSPEYAALVEPDDPYYGATLAADRLVDPWTWLGNPPASIVTWPDAAHPARLDYAFVTADLAPLITTMSVGRDAVGSDHQPVFLDLER